MKRVLLNNDAANTINTLRRGIGAYEFAKKKIADAQSGIAHFIQFLRDNDEDAQFVDILLSAMALIAEYNELVDSLESFSDHHWPKYELMEKDIIDPLEEGEYIPSDNDIEAIEKILDDENAKIPAGLEIGNMTMKELSELSGLTISHFKSMVNDVRNSMQLKGNEK